MNYELIEASIADQAVRRRRVTDARRAAKLARDAVSKAEAQGKTDLAKRLAARADELDQLADNIYNDSIDDSVEETPDQNDADSSEANAAEDGQDTESDKTKDDETVNTTPDQPLEDQNIGAEDQAPEEQRPEPGEDGNQNHSDNSDSDNSDGSDGDESDGSEDDADGGQANDDEDDADSETDDSDSESVDGGSDDSDDDMEDGDETDSDADDADGDVEKSGSDGEDEEEDSDLAGQDSEDNSTESDKDTDAAGDDEDSSDSDSDNASDDATEETDSTEEENAEQASDSDSSDEEDTDESDNEEDDADADSNSKSSSDKSSKSSQSDSDSDSGESNDGEDESDEQDKQQNNTDSEAVEDPFEDPDKQQLGNMGGSQQNVRAATLDDIIRRLKELNPTARAGAVKALQELTGVTESLHVPMTEAVRRSLLDYDDEEFDNLISDTLDMVDEVNNASFNRTQNKEGRAEKIKHDAESGKLKKELEPEDNVILQKDHQVVKAKQLSTVSKNYRSMDKFEIDFWRAINSQVQMVKQEYQTYNEINTEYEGSGVIMKAEAEREVPEEEIPVIDFYFDVSGSWTDQPDAIELGKRCVATVQEFADRGEIKLNVYYFGQSSLSANMYDVWGGGTDCWDKIIQNIKATKAHNVVLMTDGDMSWDASKGPVCIVDGSVWFIWSLYTYTSGSENIVKHLRGKEGYEQYCFGSGGTYSTD